MAMNLIIMLVILAALCIGSLTDIRKREVPDWINYSLIFTGFGFRILFSIIYSDYSFILEGVFGFLLVLAISYMMFYTGQWGGGDAKMLMGLGVLIGLELNFELSILGITAAVFTTFLIGFIINALVIGAVYGFIWSTVLAVKNRKKFMKELKKLSEDRTISKIRTFIRISSVALFAIVFFAVKDLSLKLPMLSLIVLYVLVFYSWILIKTIENSCMLKMVEPEKLTEGDWIAEDIIINSKRITGPRDLGIEKGQIAELIRLKKKGKIQKVMIKEGIPFVPSFLMAFVFTYYLGNVFLLVI